MTIFMKLVHALLFRKSACDIHMYREIEASLGIATKRRHRILYVHLHVKKVCSQLIPHNLKEVTRQVIKGNAKTIDGNQILYILS